MKVHNFSAGPAILPAEVMAEAGHACVNFNDSSLSILEISHRSKDFEAVMAEAEQLIRELIGVPDTYSVLFLTGGASSQFFMVPMNLLNHNDKAAYTDTGTWSNKAIKEAMAYGQIDVVASSKEANYNYIPKEFELTREHKYLHITTNNTIFGTEWHALPNVSVPIIADMSSNFLSRPTDISKFDLIYAGAQKNLGPAGVTLVIIKKDIVGKVERHIPTMLNYNTHIQQGSMFNTPPVFPIFVSMLTMRWIKKLGGLEAMEQRNLDKANLLYHEIDRNSLFKGTAAPEDRSRMNITFVMTRDGLDELFLTTAKEAGISGIKGHRSVGGFRASCYNAMESESIQVLVSLMKEFEQKYG
jgi:phosphoserine aminotransferase